MNKEKMSEIKADLDFKQTQMDNSATTSSRLNQELDKRRVELEKINTLDQKISVELTQLTEKMESMKKELVDLSDLKKLKADAAQKREDLTLEISKAKLNNDQTAVQLDELEQKMRHIE